mmetsp:Transcript_2712/g.5820  ORF Transcript_2712/g.5820 Transcript_2712/m.5820 type:complete len:394 (+) Transcript_2712:198-1379(+)
MWYKEKSVVLLIAVGAGVCAPRRVASFGVVPSPTSHTSSTSDSANQSSFTALYGRAIKRGALKDISPGSVTKSSTNKSKKKKSAPTSVASSASTSSASRAGGVSSKLSQWAEVAGADGASNTGSSESVELSSDKDGETAGAFREKKGGNDAKKAAAAGGRGRKSRQAERRAEESARAYLVENTVDDLLDIFDPLDEEGKSKKQRKVEYDMTYVLDKIQTLIDNPNPNTGLRVLTAGQKLRDYRMVWAGSDDAICHLGTGLHNVPLARLEEIFLTLGKKRIEVKEVIRILGPFPNVRNTLKGDATIPKNAGSRLHVEYDSMIDGTGKQIQAGSQDNARALDLDILFADESAIVCAIPRQDGEEEGNAMGENGYKVLFFSAEEAMNVKLEMLRVA